MANAQSERLSCGALRATHVGQGVELRGWVNRRRDHGGLIFIDLRDRDGISQIVFDPEQAAAFAVAETLRSEDVVRVAGTVRARPAGTDNAKLATGDVELAAAEIDVYNRAKVPPFVVSGDGDVDENLRMRYRYLDLRRSRLQHNLTVRHKIVKAMRDYFDERDFLEIETPILIKSTPEGARDFLVPSRVNPGTFYALPQSPQLLKQLLMIGGLGRYMQIARCFRDEDLRADRQPEFTQLDVEMTFVDQEDVMEMMEGAIRFVWERALGQSIPRPIVRLQHADAMRRFGSDKPDMRFDLELVDLARHFADTNIGFLQAHVGSGSRIVGVRYPGGASLSRRDFDQLTETAKSFGAGGLIWLSFAGDAWKSSIQKLLDDDIVARIRASTGCVDGDAVLIVADAAAAASDVAGRLRLHVADAVGARDPKAFAFCWVVGFPLFEKDAESGAMTFAHHPFTAPLPGQEALFDSDPLAMRAQHYDLVLNGSELGSGSIRNFDAAFQRKIFHSLGMSEEQIAERFGFFIEALEYGAPPHGGMALGIDRIAMIACGENSIREVIAFPKNQLARDLMMEAPSSVDPKQLRELALQSTVPPPKQGQPSAN